jgi:hypothetical protein
MVTRGTASPRQTSQAADTASRAPLASLRDGASSTLDPPPPSPESGSYEDEPSEWPKPGGLDKAFEAATHHVRQWMPASRVVDDAADGMLQREAASS